MRVKLIISSTVLLVVRNYLFLHGESSYDVVIVCVCTRWGNDDCRILVLISCIFIVPVRVKPHFC